MLPVPENIDIYQGDSFDLFFRIGDETYVGEVATRTYRDLTGCVGKAQIRDQARALLADFTVTVTDQSISRGAVLLTLTPAQTAALPVAPAVWDVQLTHPDGTVKTYLAGLVTVRAEVTTLT